MEGSRQTGGLPWHRCAPLCSRVSFIPGCVTAPVSLTDQCRAVQPSPGVQVFSLSQCDGVYVCVCEILLLYVRANTCVAAPPGHRRVQVPPKQTSCTDHSADTSVCMFLCAYAFVCDCMHFCVHASARSVCSQHAYTVRTLCSFTLRDCVTRTCQSQLLCRQSVS